ncbi:hypothetical protein ACFPN2_38375 [Steroidobacter flavus]|uniref:Collagen-like protein n=1 Tax=Steroidobacter flavus TaxID=1842136 RepID=A0ABV8T7F8_9GAMM
MMLMPAQATAVDLFDSFKSLKVPVPTADVKSVVKAEDLRNSPPEDQLLRAQRAFENATAEQVIGEADILKAKDLAARKLVLPPNSQLILLPTGGSAGEPYYMIVAEEIVVQGPAMITWAREDAIRQPPPDRGKAPNGAPGREEGANGEPGSDGDAGTPGYRGASAPSLILVTRKLTGPGQLFVDLRGQNGGPGGKGQDGGDGGPGARGRPASQSMFDCRRGPGTGGNGGNGGKAGPGGQGGAGGDGGSVIVLAEEPKSITAQAIVLIAGGAGGAPGAKGNPGNGGRGGPEGPAAPPFCRGANRDGTAGQSSTVLPMPASAGTLGVEGRFWPLPVATDRLDKIFSPAPTPVP